MVKKCKQDYMEQKSLKELYLEEKEKPNPAQAFISKIAEITCREESTVRQWLSGIQTPNQRAKERIAVAFGSTVDVLFPETVKRVFHNNR